MTKLLITEITRMGPAFCVIGLQRENERIHSIRPVPASANGWIHFPHQRGDILEFSLTPFPGAKRLPRLERFLNSNFHYKNMSCPHHFIRLGLTRPYNGLCWLMLDTLFPLPQKDWLEEF